jgi:hypothetical protein
LTQQIVKPPMAPHERCPEANIPQGIEVVVLRCLEKDPNKRFGNAGSLAATLERCLEDSAAVIAEITGSSRKQSSIDTTPLGPLRDATVGDRTQPLMKPRRWLYAMGSLVLLLFGGVVWFATHSTVNGVHSLVAVDGGARPTPVVNPVGERDVPRVVVPPPLETSPDASVVAAQDAAVIAAMDASANARVVARAVPDAASHRQNDGDAFSQAQHYFNAGNYALAIDYAERAISSRQNVNEAQIIRALSMIHTGNRRGGLDTLCLVVERTSARSRTHQSACSKIRASSGCDQGTSLSALRTCCVACGILP